MSVRSLFVVTHFETRTTVSEPVLGNSNFLDKIPYLSFTQLVIDMEGVRSERVRRQTTNPFPSDDSKFTIPLHHHEKDISPR